ncbi:hypothetical protein ABMX62_20350 [Vibrio vulnificus]|uniref:hypothetical protein n=1 Tax=Vibrio vulnificus TaxID=672 RepID=UPI004059C49F
MTSRLISELFLTDSKQWSWAIYKPSFWYQHVHFQPHELAILTLLDEVKIPKETVYQGVRYFFAPELYYKNKRYINDIPLDLPLRPELESMYVSIKAELHESRLPTPHENELILEDNTVSNTAMYLCPSNMEVDIRNMDSGKFVVERPPTISSYTDLVIGTPNYYKMKAFEPAQPHFQLLEFDEIVCSGNEFDSTTLEEKAEWLQIVCWICLLFSLLFFTFFVKNIALFSVGIFSDLFSPMEYIFPLLSSLVTWIFSLYTFLHHSHFYFSFRRNRFSSYYDFFKYIRNHPLALLPLRSTVERVQNGIFATSVHKVQFSGSDK